MNSLISKFMSMLGLVRVRPVKATKVANVIKTRTVRATFSISEKTGREYCDGYFLETGKSIEKREALLACCCEDNGLDLSENFMILSIEQKAKNYIGKNRIPVGDYMPKGFFPFGKWSGGSTWICSAKAAAFLSKMAPTLGEWAGYTTLMTTDLTGGITSGKVMFSTVKRVKDADGGGIARKSWLKANGLDRMSQIRVASKDWKFVGKGTLYARPDKEFPDGIDLIMDKDMIKIGKKELVEGVTFDAHIGIVNVDAQCRREKPQSWQLVQWFGWLPKETQEIVHRNMDSLLEKKLRKMINTIEKAIGGDNKARLELIKQTAWSVTEDENGVNTDKMLWITKLLLSNLDIPMGKVLTQTYVKLASDLIASGGLTGRSTMFKVDGDVDIDKDKVVIRYPYLWFGSSMLGNEHGMSTIDQTGKAAADCDGDVVNILVEEEPEEKIIGIIIREMGLDADYNEKVDLPKTWEMRPDNRPVRQNSVLVKFQEQLDQPEIGLPNNWLQYLVSVGNRPLAFKVATLCHMTAQILKKTPYLKGTDKALIGLKSWLDTIGLTYEERKLIGADGYDSEAVERIESNDCLRSCLKSIGSLLAAHKQLTPHQFNRVPKNPVGFLDERLVRGCEIALRLFRTSSLDDYLDTANSLEPTVRQLKNRLLKINKIETQPMANFMNLREYSMIHKFVEEYNALSKMYKGEHYEKVVTKYNSYKDRTVMKSKLESTFPNKVITDDNVTEMYKALIKYSMAYYTRVAELSCPDPWDVFGLHSVVEETVLLGKEVE